jgi:hypothetical protein
MIEGWEGQGAMEDWRGEESGGGMGNDAGLVGMGRKDISTKGDWDSFILEIKNEPMVLPELPPPDWTAQVGEVMGLGELKERERRPVTCRRSQTGCIASVPRSL